MTGVCLFVCVVGSGFISTSPAFVRSRVSQVAGSDDRLAQKTESGPISGDSDCVDTICADVCSIKISCMLCLLELTLDIRKAFDKVTYTNLQEIFYIHTSQTSLSNS